MLLFIGNMKRRDSAKTIGVPDDKHLLAAASPARIVENIRSLISRGVLSPGLHLRQTELAKTLGVSRVAVREALKMLAAEGVLRHDPHRGFFISNLSSSEARQLYRIRHLLESELLASLQWPTKSQLANLRLLLDRLELALKQGDGPACVLGHRAFHESIFDLSTEKTIAAEVHRLLRLTDRYRSVAPMHLRPGGQKADPERNLLDALAKRDRPRLMAAFEADRARIEKLLLHHLELRGL